MDASTKVFRVEERHLEAFATMEISQIHQQNQALNH